MSCHLSTFCSLALRFPRRERAEGMCSEVGPEGPQGLGRPGWSWTPRGSEGVLRV